jgi:hypothetical protein
MKKLQKWVDKKLVDPFFEYCDYDEKKKGIIRIGVDPKFYDEAKKHIVYDKQELALKRKCMPHKKFYSSFRELSYDLFKRGVLNGKKR